MKKRILAVAVCAAMVLSLTACGKDETPISGIESRPESASEVSSEGTSAAGGESTPASSSVSSSAATSTNMSSSTSGEPSVSSSTASEPTSGSEPSVSSSTAPNSTPGSKPSSSSGSTSTASSSTKTSTPVVSSTPNSTSDTGSTSSAASSTSKPQNPNRVLKDKFVVGSTNVVVGGITMVAPEYGEAIPVTKPIPANLDEDQLDYIYNELNNGNIYRELWNLDIGDITSNGNKIIGKTSEGFGYTQLCDPSICGYDPNDKDEADPEWGMYIGDIDTKGEIYHVHDQKKHDAKFKEILDKIHINGGGGGTNIH